MVKDSPALQFIAQGATIGSVLGPVGTVVGAIIGGILCLFICPRKNFNVSIFKNVCLFPLEYLCFFSELYKAIHVWKLVNNFARPICFLISRNHVDGDEFVLRRPELVAV